LVFGRQNPSKLWKPNRLQTKNEQTHKSYALFRHVSVFFDRKTLNCPSSSGCLVAEGAGEHKMKGTPVVFVAVVAMTMWAIPSFACPSASKSMNGSSLALAPITLQADGAGRVPWPVTLQADGAGRVPWPVSLQADGAGRVPWPVTLQADGAGRVPWPVTLQADGAG